MRNINSDKAQPRATATGDIAAAKRELFGDEADNVLPLPVEPPVDPAQEAKAKLYCFHNCHRIPDDDLDAVGHHATELAKHGMTRDWIHRELRAYCRWLNTDKERDRREFKAAVGRGVQHFQRYADVLAMASEGDAQELTERYKAKDWGYYKDLPPVEYQWQGIIAKGTHFQIYGKPKTGKTFFALSFALTMACSAFLESFRGEPTTFCGRKVDGQRVLYIIAEGSQSEYRNRIEAWLRAAVKQYGANLDKAGRDKLRAQLEEQIGFWFKTVSVSVPLNEPEHVKALLDANPGPSALAPGWDFVVVDTMFRNMSGNVNDPKDSAAFGKGVDTIREVTGATVAVLLHEGKDSSRGPFGSMLQSANADGTAKISRGKDGERIFSLVDLRNGDDGQDDIVYRLVTTPLGLEEQSCFVEFIERRPKGGGKGDAYSDDENKILAALRDHAPKSLRKLGELTGVTLQKIRTRLKWLREQGHVAEKGLKLTAKGATIADRLEDDFGTEDGFG